MKINKLLLMAFFHFLLMFFLMYAMIDNFGHFYLNINKFYMALIMTAPMLIIEILLMGSMYDDKKALNLIFGVSIIMFIASFIFIREQYPVGNKQFLNSMIPHHSSAILMCEEADLTDPEIIELCDAIVETQKEEIDIMKEMLNTSYRN